MREERFPVRDGPARPGRVIDCGDDGVSRSPILGDPESDPALNGWKDTDGRRALASWGLAMGRAEAPRIGNECGGSGCSRLADGEFDGELVSEPIGRTDLSADIGLVPSAPGP